MRTHQNPTETPRNPPAQEKPKWQDPTREAPAPVKEPDGPVDPESLRRAGAI